MYFDEFSNRLKANLPGIVLFFGDSESVISEGNRAIQEKFKKTAQGGTLQTFNAAETPMGEVLAAAQTASLFASAQLLVVQNAEKALGGRSEEALDRLRDYFSNPNPSSHLVFLAPGLRKTAKAVSTVERMGWVVQCSDMPDWKLSGFLKQLAQGMGVGFSEEAAQVLVEKIGPDIAYLKQTLRQLADYVYPQKSISVETVREWPVPGVESEVFPLLDAVGSRQAEKALRLMGKLEDGVDTGTVMLLYGRIRELLMVAAGKAKGLTQSTAAEKLGLHPFRLKNLWEQSSQFTLPELKGALLDLIHLQAGVVTGRLSKGLPVAVLELWILKWCQRRSTVRG